MKSHSINKSLLSLAVGSVLCTAPALAETDRSSAEQPNVVFFFVDDIGYADMGFQHQSQDVVTPHMDQLAAEGAVFSAGYVTAAVCGPSRAGLLTGRYQQRFGYHDNIGPFVSAPDIEQGLPLTLSTLGNYFQDAGYVTGFIGKSHDGEDPKFWPHNRGFDEYYGFNNGAADYFVSGRNVQNAKQHAYSSIHRNDELQDNFDGYLTDIFGNEAVEFIERHKENPFFLYVPFNASHGPMQAKAEDLEKFSHITEELRRKFVAMTYNMDLNIGRIVDALEENDLMENTLLIFISDNGGKPKGNGSYNTPLRGDKNSFWEGGIRVPFTVTWRGTIPANQRIDDPVISLDILPTTLAAAGVDIKDDWQLDGVNLLPRLLGETDQLDERFLYWAMNTKVAIRDNDWKMVIPYTLADHPKAELYHISQDISESHDLAEKEPEQLARLMREFKKWEAQNEAPKWGWNRNMFPYANGWRGRD
ncbi:sulfatase-like hydrolase/transferase [Thaumasiovibrio subtropicus]|uniref:sulfatase-like hydrolase/transferase n=1 Tax=Thaumasiovibrio subtropicus TaxID=1891207 RepID=UPI000B35AC2B|nr:sulfatase-like hydrolase/transferase [Thaumasiovibrio subtropicus]